MYLYAIVLLFFKGIRMFSFVGRVSKILQDETKKTRNHEDAWNAALVDVGRLANAHCELIVIVHFFNAINKVKISLHYHE